MVSCMDNMVSEVFKAHAKRLVDSHDQLLQSALETGSYSKLYSFKHILNGFAVHTTPSQVLSHFTYYLILYSFHIITSSQ